MTMIESLAENWQRFWSSGGKLAAVLYGWQKIGRIVFTKYQKPAADNDPIIVHDRRVLGTVQHRVCRVH